MPRRSSSFQRLIATVENQLGADGVKVLESVELAEYRGSSKREVDVLIEGDINGHIVRIALECRDHRRRQDKIWIDQLIGKYRDIKVDKIVAVSRSGFTQGAQEKATEANIETLTFEEALNENWPRHFKKVYGRFLVQKISRMSVHIEYEQAVGPSSTGDSLKTTRIVSEDGALVGTLEQVVMSLYTDDARHAIHEKVGEHITELTSDDQVHQRQATIPYDLRNRYLVDHDGKRYKVSNITLQLELIFQNVPASDERRYIYKGNQVMVSTYDDARNRVSVLLVQTPEEISMGRLPEDV